MFPYYTREFLTMFKYLKKVIKCMKLLSIKVWITILATLTAVVFIILSTKYPDNAVIFFSIEVIVLPAIYIVGNYCAEHMIKKEYDDLMQGLYNKTEKLNEDLTSQIVENTELRTILDMTFDIQDGNKKK